ncbi:hypothetical protein LC609_21815 [Nostoc sp. XA013]|nr:hypothetical protein [Nostoc sp. XA013]
MHHSLKIKILDLDHIESAFGRDITDMEAEKILGGEVKCPPDDVGCIMNVPPIIDPYSPSWMPASNFSLSAFKLLLTETSVDVLTKKLDLSLELSKS